MSDAAASLEPDGVAVAEAIRAGTLSASEMCEAALVRAAAAPGMFWSIDADRARADAAAIDRDRADGRLLGPLGGVPIAVKDNYEVAGVSSTMGLAAPLTDAPSTDAEAVARLRGAGAIVIGTTAMDQLAWSMNGTAPERPELDNPAAPGRLTGGSSGGSAAAVAAGIVPVALGSDTAGSVRLPAAWCGVLGFKPSKGVVSLRGVAPLAPSLDTAGVLTRSARDQIAVLQVLAGIDLPGPLPPPRCAVVTHGVGWFDAVVDVFAGTDWRLTKRVESRPRPRLGQILASEFAVSWGERLSPEQVSSDVWAGIERGRTLDAVRRARRPRRVDRLGTRRPPDVPVRLAADHADGCGASPSARPGGLGRGSQPVHAAAERVRLAVHLDPCGTIDGCPVGVQLVAAPGDDARLLGWAAQAVATLGDAGGATCLSRVGEPSGAILWEPSPERVRRSQLTRYTDWLERERGVRFDSYEALRIWSITELESFWGSIWEYFDVRADRPRREVLVDRRMPGTDWFPGSTLNYAEHVFRDREPGRTAVVHGSETAPLSSADWADTRVPDASDPGGARRRRRQGAGTGSRRCCPTVWRPWHYCWRAPASGRCSRRSRRRWAPPVWSTASVRSSRRCSFRSTTTATTAAIIDLRETVARVREALPSLARAVALGTADWDAFTATDAPLTFARVPFRPSAVDPVLVGHDRRAEGDRPQPRRDPARASQEAPPARRSRPRRPAVLVHHDGLDDVELPRRRAADAGRDRALRRQPQAPRSRRIVGRLRRRRRDRVRFLGRLSEPRA